MTTWKGRCQDTKYLQLMQLHVARTNKTIPALMNSEQTRNNDADTDDTRHSTNIQH